MTCGAEFLYLLCAEAAGKYDEAVALELGFDVLLWLFGNGAHLGVLNRKLSLSLYLFLLIVLVRHTSSCDHNKYERSIEKEKLTERRSFCQVDRQKGKKEGKDGEFRALSLL